MKLLLVEDEPSSRVLLGQLLAQYGSLSIAEDGEEGIEQFRLAFDAGAPYDVVFLDIVMPKLNGRDVLRAIRSIEEQSGIVGLDGVKVIMTTALEDADNVLGAFREGCEAYLVKPVDQKALSSLLEGFGFHAAQ
ncbi:MAG: response regulator [Bdellovibrionales bacterium]|nr:response regulator [Bdellovibrionales bacterium]